VRELRVALTVDDYQEALRFYRDALGLPVVEEWDGAEGAGAVLDAGRVTFEVLSTPQAVLVDRVGSEVLPTIRGSRAREAPTCFALRSRARSNS
jgi:catechol 2,3-dioxygenase-like lactoylglutathione lyase family enzyme